MKTMKAYIQPVTTDVPLMPDTLMRITGPESTPAQVGAGEQAESGSMMFDVPGNKRRQL
jgi:hypothetical protein